LKTQADDLIATIKQQCARAKSEKPAYGELYPFLEGLFVIQARVKDSLNLSSPDLLPDLVDMKWAEGSPLLRRWEFPLDLKAAAMVLAQVKDVIPESNHPFLNAHGVLSQALDRHPEQDQAIWRSFLEHEWEPWEEWLDTEELDVSTLLFLARSCLRPSLEWVAEDLLSKYPLPASWLKGYCPICGSLPALLFLRGEGERMAYCSWCGTTWGLHRLQCPTCDNRYHESLGYFDVEGESIYRVHYCRLCKSYFKLIDTRELLDFPYLPLEEWTTLHLDLLARQEGWQMPPSPSPAVYADSPGEEQQSVLSDQG
jgi:FdhE protein